MSLSFLSSWSASSCGDFRPRLRERRRTPFKDDRGGGGGGGVVDVDDDDDDDSGVDFVKRIFSPLHCDVSCSLFP